jgi:hypothetical protein
LIKPIHQAENHANQPIFQENAGFSKIEKLSPKNSLYKILLTNKSRYENAGQGKARIKTGRATGRIFKDKGQ